MGHTVLVFQAGSHLRVQSRMPVPDTVMNPVVRRGSEEILTPPTLAYSYLRSIAASTQDRLDRRP